MSSPDRPLSPHLQVYRPQITSVMSILHRLTGIALAVGTLLLVWWLVAAAAGPDRLARAWYRRCCNPPGSAPANPRADTPN